MRRFKPNHALKVSALAALSACFVIQVSHGTENVPHTPFAEWANVPSRGQLVVRATYQESEAYYFWAGNQRFKADWRIRGEHYGIDINQGFFTLDYGITERWAVDLSLGYTTVGWRFFSNFDTNGGARSTTGLMDMALGVRYQICREDQDERKWLPTLSFRAGAVIPGTYEDDFPFAPGNRSIAIEPELLARKHFGWEGFGAYADALFRWNKSVANDQYIVGIGFFQEIQRWELNAGYRHLGSINGDNIRFNSTTRFITYPRDPRENQDSIEAGFSYRTKKHDIRAGFYSRTVVAGTNTDKKFWLGAYIEMPFDLAR